jgi:(1->4)-alpha-D-glucan 1-alpha-D-glucosylmutase
LPTAKLGDKIVRHIINCMNAVPGAPAVTEPTADGQRLNDYLYAQLRIPVATYRLQLHTGFTFQDARDIISYLNRLGVTDCYLSPYFRARPGSTHGYDICDYTQLNPELGSQAEFQALVDELARHGMGQVLDFVPNHMAADARHNRWWRDILENGPASPFARFFDVDWDPVKPELRGKVLLSLLGDHYGLVLERGELRLDLENNGLVLRYFDTDRPIDPKLYPQVFRINLDVLRAELKDDDPHLQEFLSIITALDHLPASTETAADRVAERQREIKVAGERLARLLEAAPRFRRHVEDNLRIFNGQPGKPESFDPLHNLLEKQPYRLAYWKTAFQEINYRRFFDIKELAALRMEEPAVFAAAHALVLRLIREGKVTGLRLDHIDGLFDPAEYVDKLQQAVLLERAAACEWIGDERTEEWRRRLFAWRESERSDDPKGSAVRPLFMAAEKILSGTETLPDAWVLYGTTGYDFLNDLTRLFVDPQNARAMKRAYERFTGTLTPFAEVAYQCKRLIIETALASELHVLAHALNRLSEGNRRARDFTLVSLQDALREVVACFPVYRTYVGTDGATDADRQMIDLALARARRRNPAMEPTVFDFVRSVILPDTQADISEEESRRRLQFAMKFQQYTGPVQAKGIEDTAFYRYNVLVSLNEVGGDPQRFGGSTAQFHEANRRRLANWPATMLATATHDTKRGEDARARLNVLSETPEDWRRCVARWARINARHRQKVDGEPAPDRNDEYLFYQTLLASWPAEPAGTSHTLAPADLVERLRQYMVKAVKEAKVHTSWINPNKAYDDAVIAFVDKVLRGPRAARFLADFLSFQHRIARLGMLNSLAQVVLKVASPGVPDIYQGTELWDLSLVDPDNRRPVDFAHRGRLLEQMEQYLDDASASGGNKAQVAAGMLDHWPDGRIKLFITACGLRLRRRLPRVFLEGDYLPLEIQGTCADNVVGLARRWGRDVVLAIVPRFNSRLLRNANARSSGPDGWKETRVVLPVKWAQSQLQNVFTHEIIQPPGGGNTNLLRVADVLATCPVALLRGRIVAGTQDLT